MLYKEKKEAYKEVLVVQVEGIHNIHLHIIILHHMVTHLHLWDIMECHLLLKITISNIIIHLHQEHMECHHQALIHLLMIHMECRQEDITHLPLLLHQQPSRLYLNSSNSNHLR